MLNIVLLEPEMPANTGNIGRTCCATGTRLHLIEPMGFKINDKMLKRAGLDYWDKLDVTVYDCYEDFLEQNPGAAKKNVYGNDKIQAGLYGRTLRAGCVHNVWKRKCRYSGRNSCRLTGDSYKNTNE